jgi:uncharacterized membrane protein YedE/YeeE
MEENTIMIDSGWLLSLSGCLVGAIIGYAARRSHFCTMAALERHWYAGDDGPLRAWVLAAMTALVATQLLSAAGIASIDTSFYLTEPLPIAGAVIGGLMFGVGMALVGTCGFGALVRLGGGNLRALVVLTGLGLAALAAQRGVTAHVRASLLDPLSLDLTAFGGQSLGALLSHATGLETVPSARLGDRRLRLLLGVQIRQFPRRPEPAERRYRHRALHRGRLGDYQQLRGPGLLPGPGRGRLLRHAGG